jgi:hypothetical protein
MNSPVVRELLRPAIFVHSMLWGLLTASIFFYGVIAYLLAQKSAGPTDLQDGLQLALAGVAVLTGLGSLVVPRILLSDDRLREAMRKEPDPEVLAQHSRPGAVSDERLRQIQSLSSADRKLLQLPGLYFTPFILRLVINESIAIYGLVLALISHSFEPMIPFAVAAIALNLTCMPRIEPMLDRAARLAP